MTVLTSACDNNQSIYSQVILVNRHCNY